MSLMNEPMGILYFGVAEIQILSLSVLSGHIHFIYTFKILFKNEGGQHCSSAFLSRWYCTWLSFYCRKSQAWLPLVYIFMFPTASQVGSAALHMFLGTVSSSLVNMLAHSCAVSLTDDNRRLTRQDRVISCKEMSSKINVFSVTCGRVGKML